MADEANGKQAPQPGSVDPLSDKAVLQSRSNEITDSRPAQKPMSKKPSKMKQLWQKAGLDVLTLKQMLKGSIPPTIAIAMYQATPVHEFYGTIGYIVAISSVLGFAIMPRAKFIQTMIINTVAICVASAVSLLALFCVVKARQHTTLVNTPPDVILYNSSASVVAAIWLTVQIYIINSLKASRPQLQFPAILSTIFVTVSLTYGATFPDMPYAISFVETLLETFLTGFALATGVSFLIFPLSSRTILFMEMKGYVMLLNASLKAQSSYLLSLETFDPIEQRRENEYEKDINTAKHNGNKKNRVSRSPLETPELLKIRELQSKIIDLHGKVDQDIAPAKHEIAIGKLDSADLGELWTYMRRLSLPVLGLMSMINVFERQAEAERWAKQDGAQEDQRTRQCDHLDSLHSLAKELNGPLSATVGDIDRAFNHILLTLELVKPPKNKTLDEERKGGLEEPGTSGFVEAYKKRLGESLSLKQKALADFCREHSIALADDHFQSSFVLQENWMTQDIHGGIQRSLFFVLYVEYLLSKVSASVLDLADFADKKRRNGVFDRSKIIFPGSKAIYKWVKAACSRPDVREENTYAFDVNSTASESVYLSKADPEHLPPRNSVEKAGNMLRTVPRFLRSEDSLFGLRVTAATMTIGIICYLEASQKFFIDNRLLWAMIMVAISMSKTSGQSVFNFLIRILATFFAMIAAYIAWYIVDGQTAGVIVFLWLGIFLSYYIVVKSPQLALVGILTLVTEILIIGYELQVRAIGIAAATENGQPAYPLYELAPYRLATVVGGVFVAFIWTVFPYPISETSQLRKDISASLYLISKYYSVVHETVAIRVQNTGGDHNTKGTHAYDLEQARTSLFTQLMSLISTLQMNSGFSKFQLNLGGRFPKEQYDQLITCIQRMMLWISLASYASATFEDSGAASLSTSEWASDFRKLMANVNVTTSSKRITSLLSLLSSSFSNAQPLPPYLEMPTPFEFLYRLDSIDPGVLSIQHVDEPGYSAFAVMQIVSENISADTKLLVSVMKELVGEIDFTQHLTPASSNGEDRLSENTEVEAGKGE